MTHPVFDGIMVNDASKRERADHESSKMKYVAETRRGAGVCLDAAGNSEQLETTEASLGLHPDFEAGEGTYKPCGRSRDRKANQDDEVWVDGEAACLACYRQFSAFVKSDTFDYVMGFFIVLNTVFLGVQADQKVKALLHNQEESQAIILTNNYIETCFCAVFLLELISRLIAFRLRFWCSLWNLFDLIVVSSALVEEFLKYSSDGDTVAGRIGVFRMMRIMKLLRTIRIIRVIRAFRELRIIIMSIGQCMKPLLWTLMLLVVLQYVMSILILTEISNDDDSFNNTVMGNSRRKHFNGLMRSLVTIFQCTTGGILWEEMASALEDIQPFTVAFWVLYIGFVSFAICNMLTGILVDQAIKSAQDDGRNVMLEQKDQIHHMTSKIRQRFYEADVFQRGILSREMVEKVVKEPDVIRFLKSNDIDVRDMMTFFDLIGGTGSIQMKYVNDFIHGLFRLKGVAKCVDVEALTYMCTSGMGYLRTQ